MSAERLGGVFWLAFGLLAMYGSICNDIGSLNAPGSGFLGFLTGAFISLMALIVVIQSFMGRREPIKLKALWKDSQWWRPAAVVLLILAYIGVLESLGFLLSSFLFMLIMFKGFEKFSWPKAVPITLAVVLGFYLIFHTLLKATFPQGVFAF